MWLHSSGLPTRSRAVAEYMVGLEKTKAKQGEVSRSMHALTLDDIYLLHKHCFREDQSHAERHWGIMHFVHEIVLFLLHVILIVGQSVYLLAFLMVLRMDEALKITFEGTDNIPDNSAYLYDLCG